MSTNPVIANPVVSSDVQPDGFFTRGLADADAAVFAGIAHELDREQTQIELIASENIVSKAVLEALASHRIRLQGAIGRQGGLQTEGQHQSDPDHRQHVVTQIPHTHRHRAPFDLSCALRT